MNRSPAARLGPCVPTRQPSSTDQVALPVAFQPLRSFPLNSGRHSDRADQHGILVGPEDLDPPVGQHLDDVADHADVDHLGTRGRLAVQEPHDRAASGAPHAAYAENTIPSMPTDTIRLFIADTPFIYSTAPSTYTHAGSRNQAHASGREAHLRSVVSTSHRASLSSLDPGLVKAAARLCRGQRSAASIFRARLRQIDPAFREMLGFSAEISQEPSGQGESPNRR